MINLKKLWVVFLLISVILAGCATFLEEKNKKENTENSQPERRLEEINQEDKTPFNLSKKTRNFLLIGVDSRGEKDSRSDAILLAKYDPSGDSIKLVSLMRDSYVKIPGYSYTYSKLNHAYYLGGKKLLKETIEENFEVSIDYTAVIDFQGFIKVLDAIAPEGIEVNVSQAMIEDMGLDVEPGRQKLKGSDLLSYVRFRHDDQSDFGRVDRQQEILISLKDQLMEQFSSPAGIARFPDIINQAMKFVETDLKMDEAISIGATFLMNPVTEIETLRVPVSNSYENKHYDHAGAVLQLNFEENTEALKQFLEAEKK